MTELEFAERQRAIERRKRDLEKRTDTALIMQALIALLDDAKGNTVHDINKIAIRLELIERSTT